MQMLETLLQGVRSACAAFPDKRRGAVTYSMADIGLSAFSLFFLQSESFLAHQRALEAGRKISNCQSLFGMTAVPTDNHIRAILDPVPPSCLQPAFDQSLDILRRHGGLRAFQRLGDRVLIALDGTEYFCSQKLGCPQCLTRRCTAPGCLDNRLRYAARLKVSSCQAARIWAGLRYPFF